MPTFITHKIPRQNQQILKALKGFLVSGAVPGKFISAPRITALGKKMLTSNTYSCHENAALSNPDCGTRWDVQAENSTVSGKGWQKVGMRPGPFCAAKGKTLHIWQGAVSPWSKSDWTYNGRGQWKQPPSAAPPVLAA